MNRPYRASSLVVSFVALFMNSACNVGTIVGDLAQDDPNAPTPPEVSPVGGPPGSPGPVDPGACVEDVDFFRDRVWTTVVAPDCARCHTVNGIAAGTRMVFDVSTASAALSRNFDTVRAVALLDIGGAPLIVAKPTGRVGHGGGLRFAADSESALALTEMATRARVPTRCTGEPEAPPSSPSPSLCDRGVPVPASSPLRRLSGEQLAATVRDLFAGAVDPNNNFPAAAAGAGYSTYADANVVTPAAAQALQDAAEMISEQVAESVDAFLQCVPGADNLSCFHAMVGRFGERAFRRPLEPDEHNALVALYDPALPRAESVRAVVEAVLQSPQFLYLDEAGTPFADEPELVRLDGHTIASRLSYFLWGTMPDTELLALAAVDGLSTREVIELQARRMLADPRAKTTIARFHQDWLHLDRLGGVQKDATLFPSFGPELVAAMRGEIDRFVTDTVWSGDGTLRALLTSRESYTNAALDEIYGSRSGAAGSMLAPVRLPESERSGILTRAAFLAAHAYPSTSSPVARGVFVLEQLFCQSLAAPAGASLQLPPALPDESPRERLARHRADPACATCHDRIDPIGFAFENFDALGAWRGDYPDGLAIDATGELPGVGNFSGAIALSDQLANSDAVARCYATHWFRFANGRREEEADACDLSRLSDRFVASGGNIRELLVAITGSDAFRYASREGDESP